MSSTSLEELCPKFSIMLWKNVQNMKDVNQAAVDEKLKMVLVNPVLILHPDQIFIAVNKSLHALKNNQMKTKNVFTEILYNLSPSRNFKDAFKLFGVESSASSVIIVVSGDDVNAIKNTLDKLIMGDLVPMELLADYHDIELIKKTYKLQNFAQDEILNAIITKIVVKSEL